MSRHDDTSSAEWLDGLFRAPVDPPLAAYAPDELTIPPAEHADETPTTVLRALAPSTAGLSPDQEALLARLRRRGDAPPEPTRHGSTARRAALTALVFTLTLVLSGAGIAGYLYEKYNGQLHRVAVLQRADPNIREAARQQNAANFLVIGSDSRAGADAGFGNVAGARSDTTMLVHLSPDHSRATVISIPRDAWVELPDCKTSDGSTRPAHPDMFNAAFSIGGPACTIATVQKLTGIAVTHFVEIDFSGFEKMVDALGTVTVCSPESVDDPGSGLRLHPGNNRLDGAQALAYVRARETLGDGSDLDRIKRQQSFLAAVLRQAMTGSMLSNPARLTAFLDAATKAITIDKDTTFGDLRALASSLQGLDPARVTFYTAPIANRDYSPPGTNMTGRVLLDSVQGRALYDSVIEDRKPVWVTTVNGKATVLPAAGTPTATSTPTTTRPAGSTTTPAPDVPKPNLNAAEQTCTL